MCFKVFYQFESVMPTMDGIMSLYFYMWTCMITLFIAIVVNILCYVLLYGFFIRRPKEIEDLKRRYFRLIPLLRAPLLEFLWTIIPAICVIFLILPSIALIYIIDANIITKFNVLSTGYQWFWTYAFPGITNKTFIIVSVMKDELDLMLWERRLLSTYVPLILPTRLLINVLVTSNDVIHSWAIPAFGFKVDAIPGKLNHEPTLIYHEGAYYGQCSELCGTNHGFMPIEIIAFNQLRFMGIMIEHNYLKFN
jgi:heme/copper-type cytochrome/quinol oxidase subunit 2